ncbi:MAG: hypothetical protein JW828_02405 [Sedimentisphaerales bacterium]|nr:hypothetical protein [Sedimentisphaerales bacterium]
MAKGEYTAHQQKIISNYYDHLDTILLTRLQELVTDLYLADTPGKQNRLWQRAQKAMEKLKIPPQIIEHIMSRRDIVVLARNAEEWLAASRKKR